jgi:hypothetical protein
MHDGFGSAALDELAQVGVKIEHLDATKICARRPVQP